MPVHDTLKAAILHRRCVKLQAQGSRRELCPHALGYKDKRAKVLAFQYGGGSASGLPVGGGWRTFFVDDIEWADVAEGAWRSGDDYLFKLETNFDYIEVQARPVKRKPR